MRYINWVGDRRERCCTLYVKGAGLARICCAPCGCSSAGTGTGCGDGGSSGVLV